MPKLISIASELRRSGGGQGVDGSMFGKLEESINEMIKAQLSVAETRADKAEMDLGRVSKERDDCVKELDTLRASIKKLDAECYAACEKIKVMESQHESHKREMPVALGKARAEGILEGERAARESMSKAHETMMAALASRVEQLEKHKAEDAAEPEVETESEPEDDRPTEYKLDLRRDGAGLLREVRIIPVDN